MAEQTVGIYNQQDLNNLIRTGRVNGGSQATVIEKLNGLEERVGQIAETQERILEFLGGGHKPGSKEWVEQRRQAQQLLAAPYAALTPERDAVFAQLNTAEKVPDYMIRDGHITREAIGVLLDYSKFGENGRDEGRELRTVELLARYIEDGRGFRGTSGDRWKWDSRNHDRKIHVLNSLTGGKIPPPVPVAPYDINIPNIAAQHPKLIIKWALDAYLNNWWGKPAERDQVNAYIHNVIETLANRDLYPPTYRAA